MPNHVSSRLRALGSLATTLVITAGLLVAVPAHADTVPAPGVPATVSTDALPTVQIDGIVWSQVIVGNTVYVGGSFANARPAGAAAGTSNTPRSNLLAYDVRTGNLIPGFAPTVNGQVNSVAASPDGRRLYIGGAFTQVNGATRNRIAAFDTATGALVTTFAPSANTVVDVVAATNSTVYVGGNFSAIGSTARLRSAALNASNGAVLPFTASADGGRVRGIAISPDQSKVVLGGSFTTLNGSGNPGYGLAAVSAASGALVTWNAAGRVRNGGQNSAIYSLTSDASGVYGTGYHFGSGGNLEGTFRADWANGDLVWVEDCHGDTYSSAVTADAVYIAGHPHYCSNSGGFPQTEPTWTIQRAMAWSKTPSGRVNTADIYGYASWAGTPAPTLLNWWPEFNTGTVSGATQGPWSVAANENYVVYGGEFTRVNNTPQQGLVRFATRAIAPNDDGPRLSGSGFVPSVVSYASGTVRVAWPANYDRDNEALTYQLIRDGVNASPIYSTTQASRIWYDRPPMGYTDRGLAPGSTHTYRLRVSDPNGNVAWGNPVSVTVSGSGVISDYADMIVGDRALAYWRLGEGSGTRVTDWSGWSQATAGSQVAFQQAGAIAGDSNTAARFGGTSASLVASNTSMIAPDRFAVEAWFRTTSTAGGKIVGFGNANTGNSTRYDRHVYMDGAGRVFFGVSTGQSRTVQSAAGFNDGGWHHVVASMSSSGMQLFIDGVQVAQRTDTTVGRNYTGYWRIGGDATWAGAQYFNGTIDEVAVYDQPLSAARVRAHFDGGAGTFPANRPPVAAFDATATDLRVQVDAADSTDPDGTVTSFAWNFGDGSTAAGASASHVYSRGGTYEVTLTVTDDDGAASSVRKSVVVVAPNAAPNASFTFQPSQFAVAFNGSGSTDADGTLASYAWAFGDGTTATGATPSHTYGAAGTYTVTLTVTDDDGATDTATQSVTVSAPPAAGAPFAQDAFTRSVASGLGSAEVGGPWAVTGSATAYAVTDGTARVQTAVGALRNAYLAGVNSSDTDLRASVSLLQASSGGGAYASVIGRRIGADDYRVRAVVSTAGQVTLQLQRSGATIASQVVPGTYATGERLNIRLQVTGTSPTTLRAKAWEQGTTEPATWQVNATDGTAALQQPGSIGLATYLSASATGAVTFAFDDVRAASTAAAPPANTNAAPAASFTSSVSGLRASLNGSGSSDSDGTIVSHEWDFGDGTSGTGATATHQYAAAGTFDVTLTVTDDDGAEDTVTRAVAVTAPPAAEDALAIDAFGRSVTGGLGSADVGGAWTLTGGASNFSVTDGAAQLRTAAGAVRNAYLDSVSSADTEVRTVLTAQLPSSGSAYASVLARRNGAADYRARVVLSSTGSAQLQLQRSATYLRTVTLSGLSVASGDRLQVRVQAFGTSPTTVRAKVWEVGTPEPADWQATATDFTDGLQQPGSIGLSTYLSASATPSPLVLTFDDVWAGATSSTPAAAAE